MNEKEKLEELLQGLKSEETTLLTKANFQTIKQRELRKLSNRDRNIFMTMLDADDEPNEKLIEAFKAHKELISV